MAVSSSQLGAYRPPPRAVVSRPLNDPAAAIWGSFDLGPPPGPVSTATSGYTATTGDFMGESGGALDDSTTGMAPGEGITPAQIAARKAASDARWGTHKDLEIRDPTGGVSTDPADALRAYESGNIGGASGAYNMATDSGKAQYDYMHDLGDNDFFVGPTEFLNEMGEEAGVSHLGDVVDPLGGFGIQNPLDPLGGMKDTLNRVMDPDKGLGTTLVSEGGATGGKPITNLSPGTRDAANAFIDMDVGDMNVTNVGGLDLPGGPGGGGGGGSSVGTTNDAGRGISLPDQLVYAGGDVGRTKSLSDSIRAGEFAPPSDARQLQLNSIQAANDFAGAAQGPGMGSFLSPPPAGPAVPNRLAQPANMSLQGTGPQGFAGAAASGAQPQPASMPLGGGGGAQPQPFTAPAGPNSGPTFGYQMPAGSNLASIAGNIANPPSMPTNTGTPSPAMQQLLAASGDLPNKSAVPGRGPITNQLPPGVGGFPVTSSPPTGTPFDPGNWAPPTPAAPAASPLRASLGARQDVGSYLTGSRATDPWSQQVQGFLQAPEGPSAAQAQLTQARDASMADALSLARSGRGGAGQQARALRGAMSQNAATMGQAGQAAALLRANEAATAKQQQLAGLGLGANIAQGRDTGTLQGLSLSGSLAQGIDQDTLAGQTLSANTAQGMRGLDINEAGQKQQGVLDAERIAAGRTGDILSASASGYATDRGIDSKENLGPGDLKYWTDKI